MNKQTCNDLRSEDISASQGSNQLLEQIAELTQKTQTNDLDRSIQRALFRIADMASSANDMDSFYSSLHEIVSELTSTDAFFIATYDKEKQTIQFPYYEDEYDDIQTSNETPLQNRGHIPVEELQHSLTWQCISRNEPHRVFAEGGIGKVSEDWLGVPLQECGQPVGVICIQSYQKGFRYTDSEVELMTFISSHIATALQRRQNVAALKNAHDDLKSVAADLAESNAKLKEEMEEREKINRRMVDLSHQAGKAEVATGVLHNVGNVLNSINVSTNLVEETHRQSRLPSLAKAAKLLSKQDDLSEFFLNDERGRAFPAYLSKLADLLLGERDKASIELQTLTEHLNHVKTVVAMQQSYAGVSGLKEPVIIPTLFDDAELLIASSLTRHLVNVERDFADLPPMMLEKQKVLQVIVNLLKNAKDALVQSQNADRKLVLRTRLVNKSKFKIEVIDNGEGINSEDLIRIFSHGFTTKIDGHGFGLHSSANVIREIGGDLYAASDGIGKGATFTLELPLSPVT